MRGLDDTDREILALLLEDGRRPYSDIAEAVDLSPPAVSDRVERLREAGLIRRFTVDIDRSKLDEGVPVLADLSVAPGEAATVRASLADTDAVEHVFVTADERTVFTATVSGADVTGVLADAGVLSAVEEYEVDLLAGSDWSPSVGDAAFAPACAECGNTVTEEGESATLDGTRYHFCCSSCQSQFVDHYESIRDDATS